jgi:hypothetical protein
MLSAVRVLIADTNYSRRNLGEIMSSQSKRQIAVAPWILVLALSHPLSAWACATCGCSLSTDAAMGYSTRPGW